MRRWRGGTAVALAAGALLVPVLAGRPALGDTSPAPTPVVTSPAASPAPTEPPRATPPPATPPPATPPPGTAPLVLPPTAQTAPPALLPPPRPIASRPPGATPSPSPSPSLAAGPAPSPDVASEVSALPVATTPDPGPVWRHSAARLSAADTGFDAIPVAVRFSVLSLVMGVLAFVIWLAVFLARRARRATVELADDDDEPPLPRLGFREGPADSGGTLYWH